MGVPWYILALPFLAQSVFGVTLEPGDSDLILVFNETGNQYTMYLSENNHEEGTDDLLLFYFNEVPSKPTCVFLTADTFQYKLNMLSDSQYGFNAAQYFDYETQANSYQMKCDIANTLIIVLIHIVNIDDESPTLTSPMCSMKENVDYDQSTTECTCVLSDPDGWLTQTTFTVINSDPNAVEDLNKEDKLFHFDFDRSVADNVYSTTVYITTLQQLDYETKIFYSFTVQAKDGAGHSTTPKESVTSIIDVVDVNDQPPQWTDYFTTQEITEEQAYSYTVAATDGDRGINAPIEYFLTSYDENVCGADPCVSIVTESGKGIITVNAIDRDAMDITTYKFEIMAQETDTPPYTSNITITLFVEDIDDNSPLFMSLTTTNTTDINYNDGDTKIAEFQFYENFASTIDGEIAIKDIDTGVNAQFSVVLKEDDSQGSEVEYTKAFIVVPTAGYRSGDFQISVKDYSYLDYENTAWQNFQFYVHSYGFDDTKEDELLVKIHLLDYNDELPVFEQSTYTETVKETIKKGVQIIQVKATDRDAEDATLTHQLVGADAIVKLLTIDTAEGIITVAVDNAFDYDRINPIIFQVEAIDHASPEHVTTVPVTINLSDVNNKAPTYVVGDVIQVEENQVIGVALTASITASDVDTTRKLTAQIDWDKSYVTKNSQRLSGSDPVIQKAMQFLDLSFEETTEDTIAITLSISDNNEDETAPDYETFDTLYLDIKITDLNTELPEFADKMSVDALVVINILNINDNAPVFTADTLARNRTVYEMSKSETIVGTIEAIDADIGDVVEYSCQYVNKTHDWFTCSSVGEISVTKSDEIDCDTDFLYTVNINCIATDGLWDTEQEFAIFIRDTNNKYPVIMVNDVLPSASVVEVLEKSEQNAVVTNVAYTDADRDVPFHTAVCSFQELDTECYEQFVVRSNVVVVKNAGHQLNRDEGTSEYECTVYCTDNPRSDEGEAQNTNSIPFKIKLLDINDHCPELQTFELTASENIKKDTVIGEVIAKDIDEGQNADIDISIMTVTKEDNTDYTDKLLFDMVKTVDYELNTTYKRWHLTANADLRDFYGEYTLQLKLSDLGTPPQSTEDDGNEEIKALSKLKVIVSKYNYYSPKFTFPDEENTNLELSSVIITIKTIGNNSIIASPIKRRATYFGKVLDDRQDQEAGKQLVMYLNGEMLPNIVITTGEDDCSEKWTPSFDVTLTGSSSEMDDFFVVKSISRCIAQLQVDQSYKKGQKTYELSLTAKLSDAIPSDPAEAAYTESITLNINFADPNGDPIFDTTMGAWNISLPEADDEVNEELPEDKAARYPNVVSHLTVFYSLYSDDQSIIDTFDVGLTTGNLNVKQKLDYLTVNYYEFYILAARNQTVQPNPDSSSSLPVTLWVEDVNDHTPQWTQESFFGAIMKSSQKGTTIITATATDADTIDTYTLKYKLNSTIERSGSDSINNIPLPFLVEEATGGIQLNFPVEYNMDGYFFFWISVEDVQDRFGNGPHYNRAEVTIYIVTEENTLTFKFENNLNDIVTHTQEITNIISEALGWNCHDYSIDRDTQNGVTLDNVTACNIYCVDDNTLLTTSDIKAKLNNINTFKAIKQSLLPFGVLLLSFDADATTEENLETTLKAALIGVSVVLGALCVILAVTFFLKARELNRRLKHLTEQKFGSDESNINRKGVNAPNTNMFAVEGSNPVFNEIKRDDYVDYDQRSMNSINSGDSELIGVEDNPEFDGMFTVEGGQNRF